ncbi:MAG: hypothetical protein L6R48_02195, partial [Planctomycetes bacterium]|nr:hypothetical protein [Planctomycetota bacterium]
MSAPDPADVWTRLAPLLVDLAMSRRDDVEAIARLVPSDSPLVGWNPPASDGQALSSAVSAVDRLRGANGQPSQRLLEDWADAFDRPGPQWTALRAIARAYLDARNLLPAAGSRQAAPSAPAQAPTRAASSRRPVAAPAPAQGQAGSLPKAAADSWARLVPRLIESGQARRVGEPQRAVCDHYRRQGWDPGELTAWVPSPADLEVLVAAEVLRKHLFSTPPSRQALMAGDFIGQLRSLSRHAALMQALAQAYLDAHGVGGPMRPSRGGRGGRGGRG